MNFGNTGPGNITPNHCRSMGNYPLNPDKEGLNRSIDASNKNEYIGKGRK